MTYDKTFRLVYGGDYEEGCYRIDRFGVGRNDRRV